MYDWRTELQIRAEGASYGMQTNKVCRSAIEELDRLRAQVDRLADGQLYQDKKIDRLREALEECLREHGGFTIKGECEARARAALSPSDGEEEPASNENVLP